MTQVETRAWMWRPAVTVALAAFALLAAPHADAAKKKPADRPLSYPFHWSAVPGGERVIEVYGVNGNIHATHSESETLFVDAVKRGLKSDPEEVKVSAELTERGARICARYPSPSGDLGACGPGQRIHDNDVIVDFTLQLPPGARLIANTVNGSIGGDEVQGPVEATTVNGGIDIVSTHRVVATTVNGDIDVTLGPLGWSDPMTYSTVNGSVLLRVPSYEGLVIDARTTDGHVDSPLEFAATEARDRQHLVATRGKGGQRLRIETVKGNIEVLAQ